jgi:predicted nucleic acid-binding protein
MKRLVLDTGALIGVERADRDVLSLLVRARAAGAMLTVPAGVVAQAWRNGRTQARLARFLSSSGTEVQGLDDSDARAAGQICGASGTSDIVDASVVVVAQKANAAIMTADPHDLHRLDPRALLIEI